MNLTTPINCQVKGTVQCPGDKSISQRVLMIGAFMNQEMKVDGFLHGEDPISTMNALNQIGARHYQLIIMAQFKYQKETIFFAIAKNLSILAIQELVCVSCWVLPLV